MFCVQNVRRNVRQKFPVSRESDGRVIVRQNFTNETFYEKYKTTYCMLHTNRR